MELATVVTADMRVTTLPPFLTDVRIFVFNSKTPVSSYRLLTVIPLSPRSSADIPPRQQNSLIQIGFLNAQSAGAKFTNVHNCLIDHDIDVFCLTETWLEHKGDEVLISQMIPPGYLLSTHQNILDEVVELLSFTNLS